MTSVPESGPGSPSRRRTWRQRLLRLAGAFVYMIPVFFLWSKTRFPESFGIPVIHGRGGAVEHWYYSYLLLDRGGFWDVVTFLYMWVPLVALAAWCLAPLFRKGPGQEQGRLP